MEIKVVKCYFSYSFHVIFLKLYENNGLGVPTIGCAQFADSSKLGILVNLHSIFLTDFNMVPYGDEHCETLLLLQFSSDVLETL